MHCSLTEFITCISVHSWLKSSDSQICWSRCSLSTVSRISDNWLYWAGILEVIDQFQWVTTTNISFWMLSLHKVMYGMHAEPYGKCTLYMSMGGEAKTCVFIRSHCSCKNVRIRLWGTAFNCPCSFLVQSLFLNLKYLTWPLKVINMKPGIPVQIP